MDNLKGLRWQDEFFHGGACPSPLIRELKARVRHELCACSLLLQSLFPVPSLYSLFPYRAFIHNIGWDQPRDHDWSFLQLVPRASRRTRERVLSYLNNEENVTNSYKCKQSIHSRLFSTGNINTLKYSRL